MPNLAFNDKGDAVYYDDAAKAWKPSKKVTNDKGESLFFDGKGWNPGPSSAPKLTLKGIGKPLTDIAAGKGIFGDQPAKQTQHPDLVRPALGIALPAAAQLIPGVPELEGLGIAGLALKSGITGLAGGTAELFTQGKERLTGQRKELDWPGVARAAGLNAAFEFGGGLIGKGISAITKAGKFAEQAPAVAQDVAAGRAITGKQLQTTAESIAQEREAKQAIDTLGRRLGMTEEQSRAMVQEYEGGRAVGDAFYKADRFVQGEFNQRYDKILKPYEGTVADGKAVSKSINDSFDWLKQTRAAERVRPEIANGLQEIERAASSGQKAVKDLSDWEAIASVEGVKVANQYAKPGASGFALTTQGKIDRSVLEKLEQTAKEAAARGETSVAALPPGPKLPPVDVAQLRSWQTSLRALQRSHALNDTEDAVVSTTERALHNAIASHLKPEEAVALDAVDSDYGVFKSNFNTFWKALKDKKSLSEYGDAIYDQFGNRPDALRYMLSAADRAGQMPQMRTAFINKLWRESQVPGGTFNRAAALKKYADKFGAGTQGEDVLHMLLGNTPGVSQGVGQFVNRLGDMNRAQETIKNPAFLSRISRNVQFRMIIGSLAGSGVSYAAFGKDPATALATGMGLLAGAEGLNFILTQPGLSTKWAQWIATNPKSEEFINRGSELVGIMAAQMAKRHPTSATPSSPPAPGTPSPAPAP